MKHPLRTLLLAVCCGLAAACTQRQERLKLMSYNIRNGICLLYTSDAADE